MNYGSKDRKMQSIQKDFYKIFPTLVGIYKNGNTAAHSDINTFLKIYYNKYKDQSIVKQNKMLEQFYQTSTGVDQIEAVNPINNFVINTVIDFMIEQGFDFNVDEVYIADCWANISTGTISTHTPHTHSNSLISAVYYVSAPINSGNLYFLHPCMQVNSIDPDHSNTSIHNSTEFVVAPEEGQCVVFKSSTIHGTTSNALVNEYRISIAYTFNIKKLGKKSLFSHYEQQL